MSFRPYYITVCDHIPYLKGFVDDNVTQIIGHGVGYSDSNTAIFPGAGFVNMQDLSSGWRINGVPNAILHKINVEGREGVAARVDLSQRNEICSSSHPFFQLYKAIQQMKDYSFNHPFCIQC